MLPVKLAGYSFYGLKTTLYVCKNSDSVIVIWLL